MSTPERMQEINSARGIKSSILTVVPEHEPFQQRGSAAVVNISNGFAIAPVAGIPPNNPEPIFPISRAISSVFDLCFAAIIPSETTAESRDQFRPA